MTMGDLRDDGGVRDVRIRRRIARDGRDGDNPGPADRADVAAAGAVWAARGRRDFAGLHAVAGRVEVFADGARIEFTPAWIIAASLTALIGWVPQPGIIAAVGSGKTELEGRVGYTYGTMIKRFCAMGWVFTGVVLAAIVVQGHLPQAQSQAFSKHRELAFGIAMQQLLPMGVLGVMFASIFAAQMATLSAQMVNSSALASKNIY